MRLAGALLGLDEGAVDPLLVPAPRHNRPPMPPEVLRGRAQAAAMDALMLLGKHHYGRQAAAEFVAKELKGSPLLAGSKEGQAWRAVARWRDEAVAAGAKRRGDARTIEEVAAGLYRSATREVIARLEAREWDRARVEAFACALCRDLKNSAKGRS
jgi:hypothetical protein